MMLYRKYLQKFFFNCLFLILISFIFQSCNLQENISESQKLKEKFQKAKIKKDRKSNSNFFAYYNSYYLAKVKFRDALELSYQEKVSGNQRNSKASSEKLFDDAIKYSLIVINDFENSNLYEDAAYIIARSSYNKNLLSPATYYFKEITNNDKSPYYYDSLIRLGLIYLELNNKEALELVIDKLDKNFDDFNKNIIDLKKKIPYVFLLEELQNSKSNYFILKARYSSLKGSSSSLIEEFYLNAINNAINDTQKKNIYFNLIAFFETLNDEVKVLNYLNELKNQFEVDKEVVDLMQNWFDYNRKLGFYNEVFDYIDYKLNTDLEDDKYIYYNIEKAKTLISRKDFSKSEILLNGLLDKFEQKINSHKISFSEVYSMLGFIYLSEFKDYEKSLDYYSLAVEKNPSNLDLKNKFIALESFVEIYNQFLVLDLSNKNDSTFVNDLAIDSIANKNILLPDDYRSDSTLIDSLIFDMSSILYFNLNLPEDALENLNLINEDNNADFMKKVFYFKSELDANFNIDSTLIFNDLLTGKNNSDSINTEAFRMMDSSILDALNIFKKNYEKYNDPVSLYMAGFINDYYLNDIEETIYFYKKYIDLDNGFYISEVSKRYNEIKKNFEDHLQHNKNQLILNQSLNYIQNITEILPNDSLISKIKEIEKKVQGKDKDYVNDFLKILNFPSHIMLRDTLIQNENYHFQSYSRNRKNMTNLLIEIADILYRKYNLELGREYYQLIADFYKDETFYGEAMLSLSQLDKQRDRVLEYVEFEKQKFLELDKLKPRNGSEVISAVESLPQPMDIEYEISIKSNQQDSTKINKKFNVKYKNEFMSYDEEVNAKIGFLDTGENIQYFISDSKIFKNKNSIVAINPDYSNTIDISEDSYYFDKDFPIIFHEIYDEINNSKYRYNINNSSSDCEYLGQNLSCYEIDYIPSDGKNPKTSWILEAGDNIFIKVKELEFDNNGSLLYEKNYEYLEVDFYRIINKIKLTDFNLKTERVFSRSNIKVNQGKFGLNKTPIIDNKKMDYSNNFFFKKSSKKNNFVNDFEGIEKLEIQYEKLFSNKEVNLEEDNPFNYVQSINQYFYFVEDASFNGTELSESDWLVAYNGDVIVGARKYVSGAKIDIPIMGYDNSSENTKISTEGYCKTGDLPIIRVHRSDGTVLDLDVISVEGDLEFKNIGHSTVIIK